MSERQESGGETCVYRVFDAQGRLLYVGITYSVFLRLGKHNDNAPWAHYATTITLERFKTREEAEAAEAEAILTEDPVWNQHGRPVRRFMQWMHAYPNRNPDDVDVDALMRRTRHLVLNTSDPKQGESQ